MESGSLGCNGEKAGVAAGGGWRRGLYLQRYPITAAGINFPAAFPRSDENLQSTLAAMRSFPFHGAASLASTLLSSRDPIAAFYPEPCNSILIACSFFL